MINWISKNLVIALHDRQIAEHGGSSGLRDDHLLESALAKPQQLYAYGDPPPDLADLAASLAHELAKNHAFVDGNKRTAYVSYRTFLALNGAELVAGDDAKYVSILALAESKLSEQEFAVWLRSHLHGPKRNQVNQPKVRTPTSAAVPAPAPAQLRSKRRTA
jgi:death on curing protein